MKKIYNHKYFPRFFFKKYDGGKESGVTGYFLLEWKPLFSIGLLRFNKGSRENSHSHAFNACTWWLSGHVTEILHPSNEHRDFKPSLKPKITTKDCFHKVFAHRTTWALTFRGPWDNIWKEFSPKTQAITKLTHGRKVVL